MVAWRNLAPEWHRTIGRRVEDGMVGGDDDLSVAEAERLRSELVEAFGEVGLEVELAREPATDDAREVDEIELPGARQGTVRKVLSFKLMSPKNDE